MRLQLHAVVLALLLASPAAADIVDTKSERQVSLPGANFRIVIPREDWLIMRELTRSDTLSVYYALASQKRGMSLWIFIDQTPVCQSAKACVELAMKNKAYDDAKDVRFAEHEGFSVVQFTLEHKDAAKQQHLVAATYVDGCWVDVHVSQATGAGTSPDSLLAVLKLLSIR